MNDIPEYPNWKEIQEINYGWSGDKKYYIKDIQENEYLLRLSDKQQVEQKEKEFQFIKAVGLAHPNLYLQRAISSGFCNGGESYYQLLQWVTGIPLEEELKRSSEQEQYQLGIQAGELLCQLHQTSIEANSFDWEEKKSKIKKRLEKYQESRFYQKEDQSIIDFVLNNLNLISNHPATFCHGDYHVGNMVYHQSQIGIIDFNRCGIDDPYDDFYKTQSFDAEISPFFAKGKIDGYFNQEVPTDFWISFKIYNLYISLFSLLWADRFGEEDVIVMQKIKDRTIQDYPENQIIPNWYLAHFGQE